MFDNQNCFQLSAIQSVSLGLPGIIIGQQLGTQYGPGTAICSILVANLILWLVAIAIISMVDKAHANAIENVKTYLGRTGGNAVALVLMGAFLNWYAFQINFSLSELANVLRFEEIARKDLMIRVGAALGLMTSLLAIGGIRLLKRICVVGLPLLIVYHAYAMTVSGKNVMLEGSLQLSLPAVLTAMMTLLPGVINFPTFFRHARSKAHAYFALTILTILISFFQISTIWIRFTAGIGNMEGTFYWTLMPIFIIVILTTCNLLNIYLASACWEAIVPRFSGAKGFAIIGLLGTLTYTFVQISRPVQLFQDLTNAYIADLGSVLLMAFLIKIIVKHRPRPLEKWINLAAWFFGCIVATIYEIQHPLQGLGTLMAGVNTSLLFYLCVIFLEETIWAVRKKWVRG